MGKDGYGLGGYRNVAGTAVLDRCDSGTFSIPEGSLVASGTFHWLPSSPLVITMNGRTASYPTGIGTVYLTERATAVTGNVIPNSRIPTLEAQDSLARRKAINADYKAYVRAYESGAR
jgi:hypothetical protein